jgi:hypothetical protein
MRGYQNLTVFISSASDVPKEREIANRVIGQVSQRTSDTLGIFLRAVQWEQMSPSSKDLKYEAIQKRINQDVQVCDIFLLILGRRYGTAAPRRKLSNLHVEIEEFLKRLRTKVPGARPEIPVLLAYFKELPPNHDLGPQEREARRLRQRLHKHGVHTKSYEEPADFELRLAHDLYGLLLEITHRSQKHFDLRAFWQLGSIERAESPPAAVIYPPVDQAFIGGLKREPVWMNRLVPHVVFEDHKSMMKIEKTLRMIGFRNYNFYENRSAPSTLHDMNRIWLCIRNPHALQALERYRDVARFVLTPRSGSKEARITWFTKSGKPIEVRSPLSQYLQGQRDPDASDYTREMANVYAKDYAIIARFSDSDGRRNQQHNRLKDFFFAGIRGLGTWGATWVVDRCHSFFNPYQGQENEPIQMLIEVVYTDGRIVGARDVSNEPAAYFARENDPRTIAASIKRYRDARGGWRSARVTTTRTKPRRRRER